jgi:pyruvate dehydrogenase E1 component alpha subunit
MGQEAAPAAIAESLGVDAQVISTYRSHAPFLAHTKNLNKFFCELYGKTNGTARGRSGSMHLADMDAGYVCSTAIVGGGLPLSLGVAYAAKFKKTNKITVVYFGDGAVEQGSFWESLNVSSVMELPILYVCEDNNYAVSTPKERRHGFKTLKSIVEEFGIRYLYDDTNDSLAIHSLVEEAKKFIKEKSKPAFMHIKCHRMLEHVGIKINTDYEWDKQANPWVPIDSLVTCREALLHVAALNDVQEVEQMIDEEIIQAVALAKLSDLPLLDDLLKGVYYV